MDLDLEYDSGEVDDEAALEVLDLNQEFNEEMQASVKYPSVLIDGLTSAEEVEFFKNRQPKCAQTLPLYCNVDFTIVQIGEIDLTMETLLMLRHVADYKLTLMRSSADCVEFDLNDPVFLSKFIKLA